MTLVEPDTIRVLRHRRVEAVTPFRIGSLGNPSDRSYAAELIARGQPVAAQMFGVFGLWVRADDRIAIDRVRKAKRERTDGPAKPFATMISTPDFIKLIDFNAVDSKFAAMLRNGLELQRRIGALCHIRAPIKPYLVEQHDIPPLLLSYQGDQPIMQNLDPFGHSHMSNFIRAVQDRGIQFVGVTTLNDSENEPEIIEGGKASDRCQERGIELLLTDYSPRRDDIRGSFAILDISEILSWVRDGFVPANDIETILGLTVDRSRMKPSKYRKSSFPVLDIDLDPRLQRAKVLLHIKGLNSKEIERKIGNTLRALGKSTPVPIP
ncbi:hypothetical protein A3A46_04035 [Candidatus Roizmanbacteria bacterium RIFCSPLOWO2_01_FULL_37_13]|uniref:YrdC-like domain-containing protein n=1 Tax=Candidatus Roizmanbacteria bacterium RIFCSPHIGHO2_02_FULL_38_11 TaxID=1802039 RepID=A0A1F7H1R9_9BACT|nr:MAG: hypothetical protein A3C25_03405 [Candidatus Roizmanbacteria bacterium RIFCSPHIGHO2_02_FULL_38_11]OGK40947.1 MAG: hypothetical protein A3A46_04035 [Candidatus Roizmanbacteria bacterium RIFCSPLOWO2_01_FULL_37_13]